MLSRALREFWIGDGLHHVELMNHPRLLAPLRRWLQQ